MKILRCSIILAICTGATSASFSQKEKPVLLSRKQVIEKEITGPETHTYSLSLESEQFVFVQVKQKGADVVIKVVGPDGRQLQEIDSPTGSIGDENVLLITTKAGTYDLEISHFDPLASSGSYLLKVERVESAEATESGKVDQLFTPWDMDGVPGAAVAVVKNGEVLLQKGYGSANLEYDIPITPSTVFHMASVSKQFTAFAIAWLAQQGKISLDDDIRKYLPEVPDFGKKISIRRLVHHISGLRDQWNLLVMAGWRMDDVITKTHILELVRHQRELNFDPGAEYLYCNTGYTLMAEIVARVTGMSFPAWTEKNIFKPLGMNHTLFYDDHERIVKNRAYSYAIDSEREFRKSVLNYANVGATSLFTTAEDLTKWAMNFDAPVVGNKQLVAQMEDQGVLTNGDTIAYAFGQGVGEYKGLRRISHGGGDAGYRTFLVRFPDQQCSVIVLSNLASFNVGQMAMSVADIYLRDLLVETPPEPTARPDYERVQVEAALLAEYAGFYEIAPGLQATVTRIGGRLMGQTPGQPPRELIPLSDTTFMIEARDIRFTFQRNESGKVTQITIHQGGEDQIAPRVEPFALDTTQMAEFAGDYYSPELRTIYSISVKDTVLQVQHSRHEPFTLTPQSPDTFRGSVWFFNTIRFERGDDNSITGFRATNGRVRNLLFIREPASNPNE